MKKLFTIAVFSVLTSCNVLANVYVEWSAGGGFYFTATPGVGILGDATGNSALAQLIWSADSVADAATFGSANYVSGDDVWLADFTVTEDGIANDGSTFDSYGWFTPQTFDDGGAQSPGGYIYARIFQDDTPQVGDWYYTGVVDLALNLNPLDDPPPTAQAYELNRNGLGDPIDGAFGSQVVPVPEPGTMALFALGLATLGASRRRRKVQA